MTLSINGASRRLGSVFAPFLLVSIALVAPWGRAQIVTYETIASPPDTSVVVMPEFWGTSEGLTVMELRIENRSTAGITVIWDSCAVVFDGTSSRLVTGKTRWIHVYQPQAPTPIPPSSSASELTWPVDYLDTRNFKPIIIPWYKSSLLRLYLVWTVGGTQRSGEWVWRLEWNPPSTPPSYALHPPAWIHGTWSGEQYLGFEKRFEFTATTVIEFWIFGEKEIRFERGEEIRLLRMDVYEVITDSLYSFTTVWEIGGEDAKELDAIAATFTWFSVRTEEFRRITATSISWTSRIGTGVVRPVLLQWKAPHRLPSLSPAPSSPRQYKLAR